ncbi:MAG: M50 family metallopeptidase [Candidatus Pristimantibacillus sp.]
MRSWLKMAGVILLTIFLTRFIPFSDFFRNIDTLVHELGHAVVTLLLKGNVMHISLFASQSGVTYTSFTESWMSIPISLAGYSASALFAVLLFFLYARGQERTGLMMVTIIAAVGLALFVRNSYGMIWCVGFTALSAIIYFIGPAWLRQGYYLLIAFICLVESILSPLVLVYLSLINPSSAGDAASLSRITFVPAIVWAIVFTVFSLWCAKGSVALLFKRGLWQRSGNKKSNPIELS